ncbi:homoaconitase precursor [Fusarium sp. NRRL 52700]|nr:homoaconitase precursor [Fusarium sp. NRRL 52700]
MEGKRKSGRKTEWLDSFIGSVESTEVSPNAVAVEILLGFPESVYQDIVFMNMDNQDTDHIDPGSRTYEINVSGEAMAKACMRNFDPDFQKVTRPNEILVSGNRFGCGSSREQAATAILANFIHLVVARSFSNIFSRNSIKNGLLRLELPRLVRHLRATFPRVAKNPIPTLRTRWTLEWDVKWSMVHVQESEGGEKKTDKVGDIPPNMQEIIALGGLAEWCKNELKKSVKTEDQVFSLTVNGTETRRDLRQELGEILRPRVIPEEQKVNLFPTPKLQIYQGGARQQMSCPLSREFIFTVHFVTTCGKRSQTTLETCLIPPQGVPGGACYTSFRER